MRTPALFLLTLTAAACGTPDPCAENPGTCNGTCMGQCITTPHNNPGIHLLVWSGPEGTPPPECPEVAPVRGIGYLDAPPDTVTCSGPCTCSPSQGACFPPATLTANSASCPADGAGVEHTPSDPPISWDGLCFTDAPISSVSSVNVGPAQLSYEHGCAPTLVHATELKGKTRAIDCGRGMFDVVGNCPSLDQLCTFNKVEGFEVCLFAGGGDNTCPESWPVKHLYYPDDRACTCECGDPSGDSCSTTVTVYSDDACKIPIGSVPVSTEDPEVCLDVPPGSATRARALPI